MENLNLLSILLFTREKSVSSVELFNKLENLKQTINDQKTDEAIKFSGLSLVPENQIEIK